MGNQILNIHLGKRPTGLKEINDIAGKFVEKYYLQLLLKNQEYLHKSICNQKTVLDQTIKTIPKGSLKQGKSTVTFRRNCSNRFEVLATTDDDDDNDDDGDDSKSGKSENIITEEFWTKNTKKLYY